MAHKEEIKECFQSVLGIDTINKITRVGGGCISDAFVYETSKGKYFVKSNTNCDDSMFKAEFLGLKEIANTRTIRVPEPFHAGKFSSGGGFIIMEYLDLSGGGRKLQGLLGKQLATLHSFHRDLESKGFGFHVDNTIGSSVQINLPWEKDWGEFFKEKRVGVQLDLCKKNHPHDSEIQELGQKVKDVIPLLFRDLEVFPSLIHGDLWSGNTGALPNGEVVIFDPATYFGHHEAELGIMLMFGGLSKDFCDEYFKILPKQKGFEQRGYLYEFYHQINHYNLFGGGYRDGAVRLMKKLVSSV
eukprot:TRINITY_DN6055_c0_g1_i1.p1 TRINITY_DN6055_c0_g1~~TRINITY_DN6055_c0_g1_i1.p1  ORF type:complete len:300 (-),score=66.03 TRINITY_DN6055_c0_g1_i1:143-1042(-)